MRNKDDEWQKAVDEYIYTPYERTLIGMAVLATLDGKDYTHGKLEHITDMKTPFGVMVCGTLKQFNDVILLNETLYEECHLGTRGRNMTYGKYKKMMDSNCDNDYPC